MRTGLLSFCILLLLACTDRPLDSWATRPDLGPDTVPIASDAEPPSQAYWVTTASKAHNWRNLGAPAEVAAAGIALDPSGNIYLAGHFSGQIGFGAWTLDVRGSEDLFVARLSPAGTFRWAVQAGESAYSPFGNLVRPGSIALDRQGNVYVGGWFEGKATFGGSTLRATGWRDLFVTKLSPAGQFVWAISVGNGAGQTESFSSAELTGLCVDGAGDLILAGALEGEGSLFRFGSTTLAPRSSREMFVAKLSSGRQFAWATMGGSSDTFSDDFAARSVACAANGEAFLTGALWGRGRFGGIELSATGTDDQYLAKVYSSRVRWASALQLSDSAHAEEYLSHSAGSRSLIADARSDAYVTGSFVGKARFGSTSLVSRGVEDLFLAKLSAANQFQWVTSVGGSSNPNSEGLGQNHVKPVALTQDSRKNIYVTGSLEGRASFGNTVLVGSGAEDAFLATVSSSSGLLSSALIAAKSSSTEEYSRVHVKAIVAGDRCVYLAGTFTGTATFGSTTLMSKGAQDLFVRRMAVP